MGASPDPVQPLPDFPVPLQTSHARPYPFRLNAAPPHSHDSMLTFEHAGGCPASTIRVSHRLTVESRTAVPPDALRDTTPSSRSAASPPAIRHSWLQMASA